MAVDVRGLAQLGQHCGNGLPQLLASLLAILPDLRSYSVNRITVSMDTAPQGEVNMVMAVSRQSIWSVFTELKDKASLIA